MARVCLKYLPAACSTSKRLTKKTTSQKGYLLTLIIYLQVYKGKRFTRPMYIPTTRIKLLSWQNPKPPWLKIGGGR